MEVKDKIIKAYKILLRKDGHLFQVDANERSLTHRLAVYLQKEFSEYNVDCEYNRKGSGPKRLEEFKKQTDSSDTKGTTVFPDIIVHHRVTKDNFIVIEAKKSSNDEQHSNNKCTCDLCKLKIYKDELGYRYAFFVKFLVGKKFKNLKEDDFSQYIGEVG